ncbi:MAG TPA: tRNA (adenosine(37)-N6)-threonylcarbamoyltransferase complex dimerization subunit type 1 TsaB [Chitinophagaceae bacterium]|nr:tRNA (adenosine(37)-N6)-threonylcarbamoyltransferase complex dimerization subunit type 1 TsaB [Chitinophagaceae bacterium]
MALILNIDTAIDSASVCLAKDAEVLSIVKNEKQKDHAAWLHLAIKEVFEKNSLELKTIDATAVTGGPGSYTGLRIGMATVKGICYALAKPMIVLNTLEVMANAAKNEDADLLCPMIDARRMEVFTAMYSKDLQTIKKPAAITLNEKSFDEELSKHSICFFGNGSNKFRSIKKNKNALFILIDTDASYMVSLSEDKFRQKEFAELAYAEPLYLKEFYTPAK